MTVEDDSALNLACGLLEACGVVACLFLEELINSLKEEINALKDMNNGLNEKVKELSKEPSAKPVNTNAKPSAADTYSAWREQMRSMIG